MYPGSVWRAWVPSPLSRYDLSIKQLKLELVESHTVYSSKALFRFLVDPLVPGLWHLGHILART